jgi:hypothetical protein
MAALELVKGHKVLFQLIVLFASMEQLAEGAADEKA